MSVRDGETMSEGRLAGKTIVVSGGTKGVGRSASEAFAREGARVVIGGRDERNALESIKRIRECGSDGLFIYTDLEKVDDCRKLFEEGASRFDRIDGFFNYAGITSVSALDSCDVETFDRIMNVNFRSCFFCCQEAIKHMRRTGGGSIVLTGSPHAWSGLKDRAVYACSKGVIYTLSQHIAHNYASDKIRCNYLTLGWTATEGEIALKSSLGESEEALRRRAAELSPMGRILEPDEYNDALIYFMSDASSMTSGSVLNVTGGLFL